MSHRFFADTPITGNRAVLDGDEARHLASVMRAAPGDEVVLFDGSGAEFSARIVAVQKQRVELEVLERREVSRELPRDLTLAVALPKGDRQKWLVEKATELGVTRLIPLVTERGVAQPVAAALDRLTRTSIEAAKQCGRNRLLEIARPQQAVEFFATAPTDSLRLIADPAGQPLGQVAVAQRAVISAVGPEGGFTPAEVTAAHDSGWRLVSLAPRTLRIETAALVIAAWTGTTLCGDPFGSNDTESGNQMSV